MRDSNALAGLRQSEIREKVQTYFKAQLDQYLDWLDRRGLSKNALTDAREEMLDHESLLELETTSPMWLPISRFKRVMDVSNEQWDASQPRITFQLRQGRRDMLKRVLDAAEGLEHYSYDDAPAIASAPLEALPAAPGVTLEKAIADYMDEHAHRWDEKYTDQIWAFLNILVEYCGADRQLASITKQDAQEIKKVVRALPQNRHVKPELKGLTLQEVVQVEGHPKISITTVNNHISNFIRFFKWAKNNDYTPHALFEGMKVAKAKASKTERKPFSLAQTQLMYHELTENTSGLVRKQSHKWGTLLGMFTGARLNEICQLLISDIQQEGGTWFLNIDDEGDERKRVKSKASKRKVPIHSELLRIGFLEFVESRSRDDRLFQDFEYHRNGGYGRSLSRWFNENTFLPKLGIKSRELVFHSFRHTMVTRLSQANVPNPIVQCVVGHERAGVTQDVYFAEGYTLPQLKDAVERFSWQ
ncbi:tyrosine-type recombinase/integrase [Dinoroseobacter shibae]|uniref:tyrosine-type recombinase/integrase n=1 Tax=Dinoroseobacter shibae TaxID=215813 RepID=UPI00267FA3F9